MTRGARPRLSLAFSALVCAAVLAVPGMATAARIYTYPAASLTFASLRGTHGYEIHFDESETSRGSHFKLRAVAADAQVSYILSGGRLRAGGVQVDLGRRGRFDLRFVPVGRVHRLPVSPHCEGSPGHWQRGYPVGTARFHGERGYTDAQADRLGDAVSESWPTFRCRFPESSRGRGRPRSQVLAYRGPLTFRAALASGPEPGGPATFQAWDLETLGRLQIDRTLKVSAPETSFLFPGGPDLPEVVTLSPPAPFSGTAAFSRTPESTFTWTGTLKVPLPGTRPLRLTGSTFTAQVCDRDRCVERRPVGSH